MLPMYAIDNSIFRIKVLCTAGIIAFFSLSSLTSQDTTGLKVNHQIWLDYNAHLHITEKLQYYGDLGFRILITDTQWARIYGRPSLRYHLDSTFVLHGGFGVFYEASKVVSNRFELRPWQGIQIKWPNFSRVKFNHLIRVEERFNFLLRDDVFESEIRFRLRIGGRIQFKRKEGWRSFFIPFSFESFVPLAGSVSETFVDRTEFSTGLGYNASRILQFRFLINLRKSRSARADGPSLSDIAYQVQVRYALDFRTMDADIQ
jgi:Protein of unknown function (DUF2490)